MRRREGAVEKRKTYVDTWFSSAVLNEALDVCRELSAAKLRYSHLETMEGAEEWTFDNLDEFLASYSRHPALARLSVSAGDFSLSVKADERCKECDEQHTAVSVRGPSRERIERLFNVFEAHAPASKLTKAPVSPRIFIGHGRSQQWRDLRDHLQDKHGFKAEAYELGARAGFTVQEVLKKMLLNSSFACLVLTGEDETADGTHLARQNVVHETGLFQGKLGFSRAIVLLEEGTEEFSNIAGLQQIRFSKGNIREAIAEVLATIRREFPPRA